MAQKLRKKTAPIQKVIKKTKPIVRAGAPKAAVAGSFTIPRTEYKEGIGRRKVATARVRVYQQPGDFVVNDRLVSEYFSGVINAHTQYNKPFEVLESKGKFAVTVKVSGSGVAAQLTAVIHGLSRALVKMNADYQPLLKAAGLLTRDDRMKETRKIGMGGKARRQRQSPKR